MYILNMSVSDYFAWGILGKYLLMNLAELCDIEYFPLREAFYRADFQDVVNPIEKKYIKELAVGIENWRKICECNQTVMLPNNTVIHCVNNSNFLSVNPRLRGRKNYGYVTFEEEEIDDARVKNINAFFDYIATPSKWCKGVLEGAGVQKVEVINEGIDKSIFNPAYKHKKINKNKFVIFSGGKFELRKGQDLVIKAMQVLQERFDDMYWVVSWHNLWEFSYKTMLTSPHIKCEFSKRTFNENIQNILHINGINAERVIIADFIPNAMMPYIFRDTDIGLFPNRSEGATNMVMREYMACGKPVVATYIRGCKDILNEKNAVLLKDCHQVKAEGGALTGTWEEASVEEIVRKIEWAYFNRNKLTEISECGANDVLSWDWEECVKKHYQLLSGI